MSWLRENAGETLVVGAVLTWLTWPYGTMLLLVLLIELWWLWLALLYVVLSTWWNNKVASERAAREVKCADEQAAIQKEMDRRHYEVEAWLRGLGVRK